MIFYPSSNFTVADDMLRARRTVVVSICLVFVASSKTFSQMLWKFSLLSIHACPSLSVASKPRPHLPTSLLFSSAIRYSCVCFKITMICAMSSLRLLSKMMQERVHVLARSSFKKEKRTDVKLQLCPRDWKRSIKRLGRET